MLLHRTTYGLIEVGAVAKPGQVIEPYLPLQPIQPQIERQWQAKQLMILAQQPLLIVA
ncbi:hypothetical protein D3C75_1294990 [compost metagenome]